MTAPHPPVRILVVEGDGEVRRRLVADLEALLDERAEVRAVATAAEALAAAHRAVGDGGLLPLALIERTLPDGSGGAVATQLHAIAALAPTRKVLLTSEPSLKDVGSALSHGAVHGMLHRPWTRTGLREHVGAHLRPLAAQHPVLAERFGDLLEAAAGPPRPADVEAVPDDVASVLLDPTIDDAAIERLMVEVLDAALGEPPRLRVAPGAVLIEEGDDVGGIYVVLDGEVALSRHDEGGRHLLHSASTGPILGLLSLTGHKRAFLRCEAVTDVLVIPLTVEQLSRALAAEPRLGALLTRVLLTSLARRLRRADELQVEVDRLNRDLAAERDELSAALRSLAEAEAQLVHQARLATLGELAAGVAHELNNPAAALQRASEHLAEDVRTILGPTSPVARAFDAARTEPPMSTADARAGRQRLADELAAAGVEDRRLAGRLWAAGLRDLETITATLGTVRGRVRRRRQLPSAAELAERLGPIEAGARAGTAVRGIQFATERVLALVGGLRAYLRGGEADEPFVDGVDLAQGLDDAVRLLGHRLRRATIERRYAPAPAITGQPGALQQVWTNLLANAVEAGGDEVTIELAVAPATTPEGAPAVRVTVTDDGPGIPEGLAERIFEPRFTTKHGQVTFGVGLGLSISRRIVEAHGGTISVESTAGRTVFTVVLPVTHPAEAGR